MNKSTNINISTALISTERYGGALDKKDNIFLVIIFLHYNNVINRKKLISMFRQLREDKLLRKVNTYHCKINNKWYDNEGMYTILVEAWEDSVKTKSIMDFETFIGYINLLLNKNRNYCIDYINNQFIQPYINRYKGGSEYEYKSKIAFESMLGNISSVNFVTYDNYLVDGYCCEDCDGDYGRYKENQYNYYVRGRNAEAIQKAFKDFFDGKYTASHWYS